MIGLILPSLFALGLALFQGGSLAAWRRITVFWWPLAAAAPLVDFILFSPVVAVQPWALNWGPWLWVAALAGTLAMLLRNIASLRWPTPLLLAAAGVGINLMVVMANGGHMPQSVEARAFSRGGRVVPLDTARLQNIAPLTGESRLAWLSDIVPEPPWLPLANVLSPGDILLALGVAGWVYQVTFARGPTLKRASAPTEV